MPTTWRSRVWLVAGAALVTLTALAFPANAQVIHLPAAHKRPLPRNTVILRISLKPDTSAKGGDRNSASANAPDSAASKAHKPSVVPNDKSAFRVIQNGIARYSHSQASVTQAGNKRPPGSTSPDSEARQPKDSSPPPPVGTEYTVIVDDGNILIQAPNHLTPVPLGNRTVLDVVNQLRNEYQNLNFASDYVLYPASYIGSDTRIVGDHVEVLANSDDPDLRIGFGVVMALQSPGTTTSTTDAATQNSGILAQTGFQLDIVGAHQIKAPKSTDLTKDKWNPAWYTQFRLGLNADQQIQLQTDRQAEPSGSTAASKPPTPGEQVELALGQADQVALSGQFDFEWSRWNPKITFALTPSYAVSWTRSVPPPLPRVLVGGERKLADSVFTPAAIQSTKNTWAQVQPLSEFGLMFSANFLQRNEPLYYAGAGVMKREIIRYGTRYALDSTKAPDPESLQGTVKRERVNVWRAALGARLAGVLDLRVDASGSIGVQRVEPLLRVLIARAFPIGQ